MRKPASKRPALACCISGGGTGAHYYDNIPVSTDDIVASAMGLDAHGVGQVIVHARDPDTAEPTLDPNAYQRIIDAIRAEGFRGEIGIGLPRIANEIKSNGVVEPGIVADDALSHLKPILALKPDFLCIDTLTQNVFYRTWSITLPQLVRMTLLVQEYGVRPRFTFSEIGHFIDLHLLVRNGYLASPFEIDIRTNSVDDLAYLATKVPNKVSWFAYVRPGNSRLIKQAAALGGGLRFGVGDSPLQQSRNTIMADNPAAVELILADLASD